MFTVTSTSARPRVEASTSSSRRSTKRRPDWRVIAGLLGVIGFGVFASDPVFNGADLAMFASFGLLTIGVLRWT